MHRNYQDIASTKRLLPFRTQEAPAPLTAISVSATVIVIEVEINAETFSILE
ncbi:hypothetical protein [Vibrio pectenicida]|uniref:hypothetical protein n=1 Tax=Vibrio pectenicida TaxID=62763 RepID=UPI0020A4BFDF|nr:hypothetical protein [Vibrio pectenicida]